MKSSAPFNCCCGGGRICPTHGDTIPDDRPVPGTSVPPAEIVYEPDGDSICAHFADFENLQESFAAFGKTEQAAAENLALALAKELKTSQQEREASDIQAMACEADNARVRNALKEMTQIKLGYENNMPKCGACAEGIICGSVMHVHDEDCPVRQNAELIDLLRHAWIHDGYTRNGYLQMTTPQKKLYCQVIGAAFTAEAPMFEAGEAVPARVTSELTALQRQALSLNSKVGFLSGVVEGTLHWNIPEDLKKRLQQALVEAKTYGD